MDYLLTYLCFSFNFKGFQFYNYYHIISHKQKYKKKKNQEHKLNNSYIIKCLVAIN